MNFPKKIRGKKPSQLSNIIPAKLTRRHCASKVAEVFDLTGKLTPLVAAMKIDLQTLVHLKLDWDDRIPDNLRPIWETNFDTIQDIGDIRFRRAEFPVKTATDLRLSQKDFAEVQKEIQYQVHHINFELPNAVQERYHYSNYLIDPNHRYFSSVIRILAYVYRFINNIRTKKRNFSINPTNTEIAQAESYYFRKATNEIFTFYLQRSTNQSVSTKKMFCTSMVAFFLPIKSQSWEDSQMLCWT